MSEQKTETTLSSNNKYFKNPNQDLYLIDIKTDMKNVLKDTLIGKSLTGVLNNFFQWTVQNLFNNDVEKFQATAKQRITLLYISKKIPEPKVLVKLDRKMLNDDMSSLKDVLEEWTSINCKVTLDIKKL